MVKRNTMRKWKQSFAGVLALSLTMGSVAPMLSANTAISKAAEVPYVVSTDRAVYASSSENSYVAPEFVVDNNLSTRWGSEWTGDAQWIYVDLGKETEVTGVKIHWEGAFAKGYRVQFSNDEINWQDVYENKDGKGGVETISLSGSARYVRLHCDEKMMSAYGYSIYEFEVYGLNGLNKPIQEYGTNLALNKDTTASSISTIWWLIAYYPEGAADAKNAVDGDKDTLWRSSETEEDQWIYVDLGDNYEIGRVVLDWNYEGAGKYYDIQVSDNATDWTTIYRETKGIGGKNDVPLYANARYVRMYGYGKNATSNGFWLNEFEVYEYVQGEDKVNHTIPSLPTPEVIDVGSGSYLSNDVRMPQPRLPLYKAQTMVEPLPSNDWWQSLFINKFGNVISTLPYKLKYSKQGMGILTATDGWLRDRSVVTEESMDFYVMPGGLDATSLYNEVSGYGDYSVKAGLYDESKLGMESTIIKGSPYIFHEFHNTTEAQIYSNTITDIFDAQNNSILSNNGDSITADHIGLEVTDKDNKDGTATSKSYYCLTVPEGTRFQKVGSKIRVIFPSENGFMSIGTMNEKSQLEYFYQHGYAFVTDTKVTYTFDEATSQITTTYKADTQLKRGGFSDETLQNLLPHQWKKSDSSLTDIVYPSVRGNLKLHEGNTFITKDTFYGIVPQFTLPTNDEYSREDMEEYLGYLDNATSGNIKSADAYWQGKSLHPLAMGLLAADQMGQSEYMGKFTERLKIILEDWLSYDGEEDEFFLYYDPEWGTMYYRISEFGANIGITDHHFTYGYLVFAATVLATYDDEFYNNYKDMIEHMVRDYANPSDNDPLYPRFRNYDMYEGHSWAGGYADNDSGNNQEAAGESLFGWVGEYLWGVKTGNEDYRNAGIFGFTTELNAVGQYWFNYDKDNWIDDWKYASVGQIYGSTNFFGTFFHGDPVYVYGIHWLPTAEYLTSYGFDKEAVADLYQGLVNDVNDERANRPNDTVDGPDDVWQHIAWPIQSLSDAAAVLAKWDITKQQINEGFNTYWFINNLSDLGGRTQAIWAVGGASATVYEKDGNYQAMAWNPTNEPVQIEFRDANGIVGSVTVKEKSLVRVNPTVHTEGVVGNPTPLPPEVIPPVYGDENVAAGKEATASGSENDASGPSNITDGDTGTRWSSEHTDDQWIMVDLGETYNIAAVTINWEAAYAKSYEIQVSVNGNDWETAALKKKGSGGVETVTFDPVDARYVKMQGVERALPYGYSIWEMEVYCSVESDASDHSLISTGKAVEASGQQEVGVSPENVVDGDLNTRWSSEFEDDQWITIDLGSVYTIIKVILNWETSFGKAYKIQTSNDGVDYNTIYEESNGDGGIDEITFNPTEARYVKMQGVSRALPYGYSLYEFEVYGK